MKPDSEKTSENPVPKLSGFTSWDGRPLTVSEIRELREWGYRIPLQPFKEGHHFEEGIFDVTRLNVVIEMKKPHFAKQVEEKGLRSERVRISTKEPDRDEYMSTREWQSAFGQHQAEWRKLAEPRPHFMNWFMDNHGDLFSYYLMKPIFTSPYNKDALDAMKVFIQYSKQLPKSEIAIEAPQESSSSAEEILATICSVLSPEEVAAKALSDMGFKIEDFRQFVSSKRN